MVRQRELDITRQPKPLPPLPLGDEQWENLAGSLGLPRRQRQVVELILRGLQDKEIAEQLRLSVPTIRTYIGRLFLRLGVEGRLQLVLKLFAASHGRVPPGGDHQ
jgi:DNA-binding NarL/FixJ family response regulator